MSTILEIAEAVTSKLDQEAGTDEYWNETELKQWINDLYQEVAREGKFFRTTEVHDSVADQDYYDIPENSFEVIEVLYNNESLIATSIQELNAYNYTWRSLGSSTPTYWYFAEGERYSRIRLFRTPSSDDVEISITATHVPDVLNDNDVPEMPLNNSKALLYGCIAIALWKAGPGRDVERGNYYWSLFERAIQLLSIESKIEQRNKMHVFRSIHDISIRQPGPGLPSNYPSYPWRR